MSTLVLFCILVWPSCQACQGFKCERGHPAFGARPKRKAHKASDLLTLLMTLMDKFSCSTVSNFGTTQFAKSILHTNKFPQVATAESMSIQRRNGMKRR